MQNYDLILYITLRQSFYKLQIGIIIMLKIDLNYWIIIFTFLIALTGLFFKINDEGKNGVKKLNKWGWILLVLMIVSTYFNYSTTKREKEKARQASELQNVKDSLSQLVKETRWKIDSVSRKEQIAELKTTRIELRSELEARDKRIEDLSKENIQLSKELNKKNEEIVSIVTGGGSFCYLAPERSFENRNVINFIIDHKGNYPIYDVSIKVWDMTCLNKIDFGKIWEAHMGKSKVLTNDEWLKMKNDTLFWTHSDETSSDLREQMNKCQIINVKLGTIPNYRINIDPPLFTTPSISKETDLNKFTQEYQADIFARNGQFSQKITITIKNNQFYGHSKIEKVISDTKRDVIFEYNWH